MEFPLANFYEWFRIAPGSNPVACEQPRFKYSAGQNEAIVPSHLLVLPKSPKSRLGYQDMRLIWLDKINRAPGDDELNLMLTMEVLPDPGTVILKQRGRTRVTGIAYAVRVYRAPSLSARCTSQQMQNLIAQCLRGDYDLVENCNFGNDLFQYTLFIYGGDADLTRLKLFGPTLLE